MSLKQEKARNAIANGFDNPFASEADMADEVLGSPTQFCETSVKSFKDDIAVKIRNAK
jgi:hypothetical protein